jgi:BirA family transcriptional regulator, biotin operon repressor / biotin---[acetyl-CoA-carboxylase] ligase
VIDTRAVVSRLQAIESLAVIPRVASTNLVARRIVRECIENELSLPQAMIIAGEQFAGRGRNQRTWSSPPGKGIYATTLLTRTAEEMPMMPLTMATIVAGFLRDTFGIEARIKWPNDVLAGGRKIAGILIEGRLQESKAYLLIGTGVNVEPVQDDQRPNAVSIREVATRGFTDVDDAIVKFVEYVDAALTRRPSRKEVVAEWRRLAIHNPGDPVSCNLGERTVSGTWSGIDEHGRALLNTAQGRIAISAGDLIAFDGEPSANASS